MALADLEETKDAWRSLKSNLAPLSDLVTKSRRQEDAFDKIFKSFTYGKKLMRKKMSRAMREKLAREEREKKEKEEAAHRLAILIGKKAKSIAGRSQEEIMFIVEGDLAIDAKEYQNDFEKKLVRYLSHPEFTYFRAGGGGMTVKEEQMRMMKEY